MTLAAVLAKSMGKRLVGRLVETPAVGSYPGGTARVVELHPDPAAPEIVFNVHNDAWTDASFGSHIIGIFEDEEVTLLRQHIAEDCQN